MTTTELLSDIAHLPLSRALAKSDHLVTAALQVVHVIGFLLLLASLTLISLRLLGLVLVRQPVSQVASDTSRLLWIGVILAISTGILMFLTGPSHYYFNRAFDIKMVLLFAALVVHVTVLQRIARRDEPPATLARVGAVLSLVLWYGVSWAGRAIGFV
jgi:hypothetical protein